MAFTLQERQLLGVHGLLPPALMNQDHQVYQTMRNFYHFESDLDRFIFMMGLQDRSEKLFYRVIIENIELMMPIIYTPTVGLACQKYGMVFRKPRWDMKLLCIECLSVCIFFQLLDPIVLFMKLFFHLISINNLDLFLFKQFYSMTEINTIKKQRNYFMPQFHWLLLEKNGVQYIL